MKLRVIGPPRKGNTADGEGWFVRSLPLSLCVRDGHDGGVVSTRQLTGALTSVWRLPLERCEFESLGVKV